MDRSPAQNVIIIKNLLGANLYIFAEKFARVYMEGHVLEEMLTDIALEREQNILEFFGNYNVSDILKIIDDILPVVTTTPGTNTNKRTAAPISATNEEYMNLKTHYTENDFYTIAQTYVDSGRLIETEQIVKYITDKKRELLLQRLSNDGDFLKWIKRLIPELKITGRTPGNQIITDKELMVSEALKNFNLLQARQKNRRVRICEYAGRILKRAENNAIQIDGTCLFDSIRDQLGLSENVDNIRLKCVTWITQNADVDTWLAHNERAPYVKKSTFDYITNMLRCNTYGDLLMLLAAEHIYDFETVLVFIKEGTDTVVHDVLNEYNPNKKQIFLGYDCENLTFWSLVSAPQLLPDKNKSDAGDAKVRFLLLIPDLEPQLACINSFFKQKKFTYLYDNVTQAMLYLILQSELDNFFCFVSEFIPLVNSTARIVTATTHTSNIIPETTEQTLPDLNACVHILSSETLTTSIKCSICDISLLNIARTCALCKKGFCRNCQNLEQYDDLVIRLNDEYKLSTKLEHDKFEVICQEQPFEDTCIKCHQQKTVSSNINICVERCEDRLFCDCGYLYAARKSFYLDNFELPTEINPVSAVLRIQPLISPHTSSVELTPPFVLLPAISTKAVEFSEFVHRVEFDMPSSKQNTCTACESSLEGHRSRISFKTGGFCYNCEINILLKTDHMLERLYAEHIRHVGDILQYVTKSIWDFIDTYDVPAKNGTRYFKNEVVLDSRKMNVVNYNSTKMLSIDQIFLAMGKDTQFAWISKTIFCIKENDNFIVVRVNPVIISFQQKFVFVEALCVTGKVVSRRYVTKTVRKNYANLAKIHTEANKLMNKCDEFLMPPLSDEGPLSFELLGKIPENANSPVLKICQKLVARETEVDTSFLLSQVYCYIKDIRDETKDHISFRSRFGNCVSVCKLISMHPLINVPDNITSECLNIIGGGMGHDGFLVALSYALATADIIETPQNMRRITADLSKTRASAVTTTRFVSNFHFESSIEALCLLAEALNINFCLITKSDNGAFRYTQKNERGRVTVILWVHTLKGKTITAHVVSYNKIAVFAPNITNTETPSSSSCKLADNYEHLPDGVSDENMWTNGFIYILTGHAPILIFEQFLSDAFKKILLIESYIHIEETAFDGLDFDAKGSVTNALLVKRIDDFFTIAKQSLRNTKQTLNLIANVDRSSKLAAFIGLCRSKLNTIIGTQLQPGYVRPATTYPSCNLKSETSPEKLRLVVLPQITHVSEFPGITLEADLCNVITGIVDDESRDPDQEGFKLFFRKIIKICEGCMNMEIAENAFFKKKYKKIIKFARDLENALSRNDMLTYLRNAESLRDQLRACDISKNTDTRICKECFEVIDKEFVTCEKCEQHLHESCSIPDGDKHVCSMCAKDKKEIDTIHFKVELQKQNIEAEIKFLYELREDDFTTLQNMAFLAIFVSFDHIPTPETKYIFDRFLEKLPEIQELLITGKRCAKLELNREIFESIKKTVIEQMFRVMRVHGLVNVQSCDELDFVIHILEPSVVKNVLPPGKITLTVDEVGFDPPIANYLKEGTNIINVYFRTSFYQQKLQECWTKYLEFYTIDDVENIHDRVFFKNITNNREVEKLLGAVEKIKVQKDLRNFPVQDRKHLKDDYELNAAEAKAALLSQELQFCKVYGKRRPEIPVTEIYRQAVRRILKCTSSRKDIQTKLEELFNSNLWQCKDGVYELVTTTTCKPDGISYFEFREKPLVPPTADDDSSIKKTNELLIKVYANYEIMAWMPKFDSISDFTDSIQSAIIKNFRSVDNFNSKERLDDLKRALKTQLRKFNCKDAFINLWEKCIFDESYVTGFDSDVLKQTRFVSYKLALIDHKLTVSEIIENALKTYNLLKPMYHRNQSKREGLGVGASEIKSMYVQDQVNNGAAIDDGDEVFDDSRHKAFGSIFQIGNTNQISEVCNLDQLFKHDKIEKFIDAYTLTPVDIPILKGSTCRLCFKTTSFMKCRFNKCQWSVCSECYDTDDLEPKPAEKEQHSTRQLTPFEIVQRPPSKENILLKLFTDTALWTAKNPANTNIMSKIKMLLNKYCVWIDEYYVQRYTRLSANFSSEEKQKKDRIKTDFKIWNYKHTTTLFTLSPDRTEIQTGILNLLDRCQFQDAILQIQLINEKYEISNRISDLLIDIMLPFCSVNYNNIIRVWCTENNIGSIKLSNLNWLNIFMDFHEVCVGDKNKMEAYRTNKTKTINDTKQIIALLLSCECKSKETIDEALVIKFAFIGNIYGKHALDKNTPVNDSEASSTLNITDAFNKITASIPSESEIYKKALDLIKEVERNILIWIKRNDFSLLITDFTRTTIRPALNAFVYYVLLGSSGSEQDNAELVKQTKNLFFRFGRVSSAEKYITNGGFHASDALNIVTQKLLDDIHVFHVSDISLILEFTNFLFEEHFAVYPTANDDIVTFIRELSEIGHVQFRPVLLTLFMFCERKSLVKTLTKYLITHRLLPPDSMQYTASIEISSDDKKTISQQVAWYWELISIIKKLAFNVDNIPATIYTGIGIEYKNEFELVKQYFIDQLVEVLSPLSDKIVETPAYDDSICILNNDDLIEELDSENDDITLSPFMSEVEVDSDADLPPVLPKAGTSKIVGKPQTSPKAELLTMSEIDNGEDLHTVLLPPKSKAGIPKIAGTSPPPKAELLTMSEIVNDEDLFLVLPKAGILKIVGKPQTSPEARLTMSAKRMPSQNSKASGETILSSDEDSSPKSKSKRLNPRPSSKRPMPIDNGAAGVKFSKTDDLHVDKEIIIIGNLSSKPAAPIGNVVDILSRITALKLSEKTLDSIITELSKSVLHVPKLSSEKSKLKETFQFFLDAGITMESILHHLIIPVYVLDDSD